MVIGVLLGNIVTFGLSDKDCSALRFLMVAFIWAMAGSIVVLNLFQDLSCNQVYFPSLQWQSPTSNSSITLIPTKKPTSAGLNLIARIGFMLSMSGTPGRTEREIQ